MFAQEGSCEQIPVEDLSSPTSGAPNIASQAEAAALLGAAQWYEPKDHAKCERLPLSDFLESVQVISACSFDDNQATDATASFNGTYLTYVVNWNGTVPCSPENQEILKKAAGPDIAFTLEFQTNYTVPVDVSVPAVYTTKFVGPEKGVPDDVRSFEGTNKCPEGSKNVFLDDAKVIGVAVDAAQAYYDPSEHGLCGSKPVEEFLSSVDVTSACVSDSNGDYVVEFRGTIPCDAEGRGKVIEAVGPETAFTFNFNATGAGSGDLMAAQIVSGYDNTGAPTWSSDSGTDSGTDSGMDTGTDSATSMGDIRSMGVKQVVVALLAVLTVLMW